MSLSTPSIALFGGSFDPIHEGHIQLIETVKDCLNIEEIHLIPCKQSPHKRHTPLASDSHRLQMCRMACRSLEFVYINPIELESTAEEPSYSWKTVMHYQRLHPEVKLYWILGVDQWEKLHLWDNYEFLIKSLHFIVLERQAKPSHKLDRQFTVLPFDNEVSSSAIRMHWSAGGVVKGLTQEVRDYMVRHELYIN